MRLSLSPHGICAAGSVCMQWYHQDCCWQEPASWRSDGILPPSGSGEPITRDLLHSLPSIPAFVRCVYAVHAPATPAAAGAGAAVPAIAADAATQQQQQQQRHPKLLLGELVVSLERLKRVHLQVRQNAWPPANEGATGTSVARACTHACTRTHTHTCTHRYASGAMCVLSRVMCNCTNYNSRCTSSGTVYQIM